MSIDARSYVDQVSEMSKDELDALPIGVITLDGHANVVRYNRTESELARKNAQAVIGTNFFVDVAPCTAVPEFEGRFRDLAAKPFGVVNFDYRFKFPWGDKHVHVTFVKQRGKEHVDVLVVWTDKR